MLDNYLNQTVVVSIPLLKNDYNEYTYSTVSVKGRKEPCNKLVRDMFGTEIVSNTLLITKYNVLVNYLVDGIKVVMSYPIPGLSGNIEFYEVYLY